MSILLNERKMTSLEIAEKTGKKHHHLLRDIKKMEISWHNINQTKFGLVEYTDKKGEQRPMYELNMFECLYIATKFNDEARAKLVKEWAELKIEKVYNKTPSSIDLSKYIERKELSKIEKRLEILEARQNNHAFALSYANQIETAKPFITRQEILNLAQVLAENNGVTRQECLSALYRMFHKSHGVNVYEAKNPTETCIDFFERKGYLGLLRDIMKEAMFSTPYAE